MKHEEMEFEALPLRKPAGEQTQTLGGKMNEGNRAMNLETITMLKPKPLDNILEIGMGNGFFVKYILMQDETISYVGCDFSEEMVAEARHYNKQLFGNFRAVFNLGNANNLPYSGNSFNKVFTVNTIYFWKNAEKVLLEVKRVLKKKGIFVLAFRPRSVMDYFPITKYGFNTFSREDAIQLFETNGFKVNAILEQREPDLDCFGEKLKNEFIVITATKVE
jgi:ubiquinone/menaquinone biosynthesis C-methylase UbiE